MPADDHLRDLFNEIAQPPEATSEQREQARAELHQAYRVELTSGPRPRAARRWWRPSRLVGAAAAAAAVVISVVVLMPTSTPPVDANLSEIAHAARALTAAELPDGAYVYVHIDSVALAFVEGSDGSADIAYWLPESIDVWVRERSEEERRTAGAPTFPDAAFEAVYHAQGQDKVDQIGETRTSIVSDIPNLTNLARLSTDRDTLREQIHASLAENPDWTPADEIRILEHIAELMNPRFDPPPALRAALLELLGELDVKTVRLPDAAIGVSLDYADGEGGRFRHELELDQEGNLRLTRIIFLESPDSMFQSSDLFSEERFSRPSVVEGPGIFPTE